MFDYTLHAVSLVIGSVNLSLYVFLKAPRWVQMFGVATNASVIGSSSIFLLLKLLLGHYHLETIQCTNYFIFCLIATGIALAVPTLRTNFPIACSSLVLSSVLSLLLLIGGIISTTKLIKASMVKGSRRGAWLKPIIIAEKSITASICLDLILFSQFYENKSPLCRGICWGLAILETLAGSILLYCCTGYKVSIIIDTLGIINGCFLMACAIACLLLKSSTALVVLSFLACFGAITCAVLTHSFYVLKWSERRTLKEIEGAIDDDETEVVKLLPKSAGIGVRIATVFLAVSALTIEAFCKNDQFSNSLRILTIGILAFCIVCSFGCMCISQTHPQYAGSIVCADIFDLFVLACASSLSVSSHLTVAPPSVIFIWLAFASVSAIVFIEVFNYYRHEKM